MSLKNPPADYPRGIFHNEPDLSARWLEWPVRVLGLTPEEAWHLAGNAMAYWEATDWPLGMSQDGLPTFDGEPALNSAMRKLEAADARRFEQFNGWARGFADGYAAGRLADEPDTTAQAAPNAK